MREVIDQSIVKERERERERDWIVGECVQQRKFHLFNLDFQSYIISNSAGGDEIPISPEDFFLSGK